MPPLPNGGGEECLTPLCDAKNGLCGFGEAGVVDARTPLQWSRTLFNLEFYCIIIYS